MRCYCLFCETVKCRMIAQNLEQMMPCRALSPKQVQHTRSKGQTVDIVHDLTPGYVFLYLEDTPLDLQMLRRMDGFVRCLCNNDGTYELQAEDERFAQLLLAQGGVIGKTKVYQEGQMIRLTEGAFAGVEASILRVNRRNMRMQIAIPFAGKHIKTWVEYEMVEEKQGEKMPDGNASSAI